jgi:branched-chain amino acid transport system ATP-binding protein
VTGVPALEVTGLSGGYGDTQVLHGVDLTVPAGAGVAVLGRNGMGKTTLLQTIMGFVPPTAGAVRIAGAEVTGRPIHQVARAGLRLVPQGRRVFASLTVEETLDVAAAGEGEWTKERVFETFPSLYERRQHRSDRLSGGEQEMLVIARALVGNPSCLLLDEPSDGLAPKVVEQVSEIVLGLRREGLSVVLVEQNLQLAVAACEEITCLVRGEVVWRGSTEAFRRSREIAVEHLGLGAAH